MAKLKFIFEKNNWFFLSIFSIFFLSIFLRSTVDVGGDTGFYIHLGQLIFEGKKYYYDFFESNLPLSFYFYALEYFFVQKFDLNPLIFADFIANLLGILSIFFSYKILQKDETISQIHKNIFILSFVVGYFLRINALAIGEFGTKTSFLLICLYPYICYSLIDKKSYKTKGFFIKGTFMALICCLKPHYAIFVAILEMKNLWHKKSPKFFLQIDILFALMLILLYLNLMIIFTPQYFEFMVPMWSEFYPVYSDLDFYFKKIISHLENKILPTSFIFFTFFYKKIDKTDVILFSLFIASSLLLLLEGIGTIDQEVIFFQIATTCLLKFSYDFFYDKKEFFKNNKFILFAVFILPIFDFDNFFPLALNLFNIWWIFAAIFLIFCKKNAKFDKKFIIFTIIFAIISIFALRFFHTHISLLLNMSFFTIFTYFLEKKQQKPSIIAIFLIIFTNSLIFNFYARSISQIPSESSDFKQPNALTDMMFSYIKTHEKNEKDSHLVFSNWITHNYSLSVYLNKKNYTKYATSFAYDAEFDATNGDRNLVFGYLIDDLKKQLQNKNIKVIFVNKNVEKLYKNSCNIGVLEYYFKNFAIKKLFFENFYYKNHFLSYKKKRAVKGYTQDLKYDFEIYLRK